MIYGNSALLDQELDNFDQNSWNEINATNLVNRALNESKDDPVKATDLLLKIKAHNTLHPDKPYNVSELAKGLVKGAVANHYSTEEQKALRDTQDLINNLLIKFRQQYQACVEQSKAKELNLKEIAEIIAFTNGTKPDEDQRSLKFNTQRTLRRDLLEWLQTKDEFVIDNSLIISEEETPKHSSNNNNNNIQSQTNPIKQAIDIVIETTQNTTTTTTTTNTTNAASAASLENQDQTSSNNTSNNSTTSTSSQQNSSASSSNSNSSSSKKNKKNNSNNNLKTLEEQGL